MNSGACNISLVPVDIGKVYYSVVYFRCGIKSRLAGFALTFCELLIFVIPIPQISNDLLRYCLNSN
jgi:hypothetical protein